MSLAASHVKVKRAENLVEVRWADDKVSCYRVYDLRCGCRCAGCVDEITGARILDVDSVSKDISVRALQPVGGYAIKLTFTDGHDAGLFTWEYLRELDPGSPTHGKADE